MTIDADRKIKELARAIIADAGLPYTPEQLAEIPAILAAKNRYFWCIDNQEFDLMPDVFTETASALSGAAAPASATVTRRWPRTAAPAATTWCRCTSATTRSCTSPVRAARSC